MRLWARRFDDRLLTWNIDHRPGREPLVDALAFYDALRAEKGPDAPICVEGVSSGGHLALMIAAQRDVACVVVDDAVIDTLHPSAALALAVQGAFGYSEADLAAVSPLQNAGRIVAPTLIIHEQDDPLIGVDQAVRLHEQINGSELMILPPGGDTLYVHSMVSAADFDAAAARSAGFVDAAIARWIAARAPAPAPAPQQASPAAKVGAPVARPKPRKRTRVTRRKRVRRDV